MKLELKHLAGYLPYGLKIKTTHGWSTMETLNDWSVNGDCEECYCYETADTTDFKPILRSLSDLTKEIEVSGEKFVPIDEICKIHQLEFVDGLFNDYISNEFTAKWLPFLVVQKLLGWHFDIYGLIENGLAIDINTLNK